MNQSFLGWTIMTNSVKALSIALNLNMMLFLALFESICSSITLSEPLDRVVVN